MPKIPLHIRFWNRVKKTPTCWIWTGSKDRHGYGRIMIKPDHSPKLCHRISWEICFGEIENGMHILHKCDNPPCVRPGHLFMGTHQDNMNDKELKGRGVQGTKNGQCKITEKDVIEIRKTYIPYKFSSRKIAKIYNINHRTIIDIVNRKLWKHI